MALLYWKAYLWIWKKQTFLFLHINKKMNYSCVRNKTVFQRNTKHRQSQNKLRLPLINFQMRIYLKWTNIFQRFLEIFWNVWIIFKINISILYYCIRFFWKNEILEWIFVARTRCCARKIASRYCSFVRSWSCWPYKWSTTSKIDFLNLQMFYYFFGDMDNYESLNIQNYPIYSKSFLFSF